MMNRALNEINYALIHVLNTEDDQHKMPFHEWKNALIHVLNTEDDHLIPGNLFHFFHALIHVLNTEDDRQ